MFLELANSNNIMDQYRGASLLTVRTYAWYLEEATRLRYASVADFRQRTRLKNEFEQYATNIVDASSSEGSLFNRMTTTRVTPAGKPGELVLSDFFSIVLDDSLAPGGKVLTGSKSGGNLVLNFVALMEKVIDNVDNNKIKIDGDDIKAGTDLIKIGHSPPGNTKKDFLFKMWDMIYSVLVTKKAWDSGGFYQYYLDIVESILAA